MQNYCDYFDVLKISVGEEPVVKIVGGPSIPLNQLCLHTCYLELSQISAPCRSRHHGAVQLASVPYLLCDTF